MPPYPRAWHEAGHAVAAHVYGAQVVEVSLESELDDHEGHVAVRWSGLEARSVTRRSAAAALAGPLAELHFSDEGALEDAQLATAWSADWLELEAAIAELQPDPERHAELRQAFLLEVNELVGDPQVSERIARVADALDAHGTLDEALFADALGDSEAWVPAPAPSPVESLLY